MVEPTTSARLTFEDYLKTPDDERWELLNGELVRRAATNTAHQRVVGNLLTPMTAFVSQGSFGEVLLAPCDVVLSDEYVVQPDFLFI